MPLYKITERRLKRKQEEEENGLDEIKAKLREEGWSEGETDDSESESESESEDEDENLEEEEDQEDDLEGGEEDEIHLMGNRRSAEGESEGESSRIGGRRHSPSRRTSNSAIDSELQFQESESESEEEEEEEFTRSDSEYDQNPLTTTSDPKSPMDERYDRTGPSPMSIMAATDNPIYPSIFSNKPVSLCVLCRGRVLQSDKVVDEHLRSLNHARALKRYKARLEASEPMHTDDPRELVEQILEEMEKPKKAKKRKIAPIALSRDMNQTGEGGEDGNKTVEGDKERKRKRKRSRVQKREARAKELLKRMGEATGDGDPLDQHQGNKNDVEVQMVKEGADISGSKKKSKKIKSVGEDQKVEETRKEDVEPEGQTKGNVKLNRKARRILAGISKSSNGETISQVSKEGRVTANGTKGN